MNSGQAKARQSMQSRDMDCFTAFAMTATFTMTGLFMESQLYPASYRRRTLNRGIVTASPSMNSGQAKARQSMQPEGMDRHGLRPRDDGAGSRSVCGIGSDSGGLAMTNLDI
jgi:hypothetical protein